MHRRRKYEKLLQHRNGRCNGPEQILAARELNLDHERTFPIDESNCLNWRPEGEVPEDAGGYDALSLPPEAATLRALLPPGEVIPDDPLHLNYDEVVLIGPPGGVPAFRTVYEEHCSIGADDGSSPQPLSQLLGLRGWARTEGAHAWRGVFINALSPQAVAESKKAAQRAALAVFDGAAPFLKLGDYFRRSDRVLVASRSLSNSLLERLCSKLYQDQHDGDSIVENGTTWLSDLPPAIQAFRARPRRKESPP
jgi:hypothetical protein